MCILPGVAQNRLALAPTHRIAHSSEGLQVLRLQVEHLEDQRPVIARALDEQLFLGVAGSIDSTNDDRFIGVTTEAGALQVLEFPRQDAAHVTAPHCGSRLLGQPRIHILERLLDTVDHDRLRNRPGLLPGEGDAHGDEHREQYQGDDDCSHERMVPGIVSRYGRGRMTLDQAKLLFALLTLMTNVFVIGIVVVWVGARFSPRFAAARDGTVAALDGSALPLMFAIAATAVLGSLYLSEIENLEPCQLCWFQRIAIYPLMVIYGLAWFRDDRHAAWIYGMPFAIVGIALTGWHRLVQWFPTLEGGACSIGVSCTTPWFEVFGFISIPYMGLSGLLAIVALSAVMRRNLANVRGETPS